MNPMDAGIVLRLAADVSWRGVEYGGIASLVKRIMMIAVCRIGRRVGSYVRRLGANARERPAAFVTQIETFYHVVMMIIRLTSTPVHRFAFMIVVIIILPRRAVKEGTIENILGRSIHSRLWIPSLQRALLSGLTNAHHVQGVSGRG